MDWFERLTGFPETTYDETRSRLDVSGATLTSRVNGRSYGVGELTLPSLAELRDRVAAIAPRGSERRLTFRNIHGDVRALHRDPQYAGALFQVASQFNLLEMVGPSVTPEDGVGRYQYDPTQGRLMRALGLSRVKDAPPARRPAAALRAVLEVRRGRAPARAISPED